MKNSKEFDTTANNHVYNIARSRNKDYDYCGCRRCRANDNTWYGFSESARTKYNRTKHPNWKLVSKNRKQWMPKRIRYEKHVQHPRGWWSGYTVTWTVKFR